MGRAGLTRALARLSVALVAVAAIAMVGCDSDDSVASSATPQTTTTVRSSSEPSPTATPTVDASSVRDELAREQQILVFDVGTEAFTTILPPLPDAEDALYFAPLLLPRFTTDGSHIWVSERSASESRLYGLDGSVADEVPGMLLDASAGALAYLRETPQGWALTVRHGDTETDRAEVPTRGRIDLSPDGSMVAYWIEDQDETAAIEIADVATGEILARAGRVGLCQCDSGPGVSWSPSSRYLAFADVRSPLGDDADPEAGTFALDTVTGARILLAGHEGRPGDWLDDDRYLGERDGWLAVLNLRTGEAERQIAPITPSGSFWIAGDVVAVPERAETGLVQTTRGYDIESGAELASWSGEAHPFVVRGGVGYEQRTDPNAVTLHHPALQAPWEVRGWVLPSPDGEHLAVTNGVSVHVFRIVDGTPVEIGAYDNAEHRRWGISVIPVEWNAEGTHLLISIGFGL